MEIDARGTFSMRIFLSYPAIHFRGENRCECQWRGEHKKEKEIEMERVREEVRGREGGRQEARALKRPKIALLCCASLCTCPQGEYPRRASQILTPSMTGHIN